MSILSGFKIRVILFVALIFVQCKKEDNVEQVYGIPDVPVNIYINLNEPAYFGLTVIGGYAYVNGGSRGIIVYRNSDEYKAYERHSPYQPEKACAIVEVDSTGSFGIDKCSGSRYYLIDGSVEKGPATIPLKQYFTSENQGTLRIYK